jgi:UDP-N-acetylmuramoyl-L-alanyl-D-glutamate--2,6-diaminopimelate ligase
MIRPVEEKSFSLSDAARLLGGNLVGDGNLLFSGVAQNDKEIEPGDIFIVLTGEKSNGAQFIENAKSRGAVAIVHDQENELDSLGLPQIIVSKARDAAGVLASTFYNEPIRTMQSIGITGTNGKTTVTTLLYQIFSAIGRESGLIGTVETRIGNDRVKSLRTTPEATELQALAAAMRERHLRHLVMEVSSHSISLKRILGSHFSAVGFTNLSQDHLDFHNDMESYFQAKAALFTHEYADIAFINIDNSYGERLLNASEIPAVSLSRLDRKAQWHFTEIHSSASGYDFTIRGRDGILIESSTPMHGGFNLDNLLMAVAIAYHFEVDPLELAAILPSLHGAPGRLEAIELGQSYKALVDYAHSPDAVRNVLTATREFTKGRLIAILGCGGDRDSSKRSPMGEALYSGSDVAIFTSDNPRSENPVEILNQMTAGISIAEPSRVIVDRSEAIKHAVSIANEGDTILLLGKGHESGQDIGGVIHDFDDRLVLAELIEAKR